MDLNLSSFGTCNYVSGHHSTVFYDEVPSFKTVDLFRILIVDPCIEQMSRHFELLNYSEHGTVVDNVIYCCDLDVELSAKSEADETKEKDKRSSFPGLDDLLKRKGDNNTDSFPNFETKEASFLYP